MNTSPGPLFAAFFAAGLREAAPDIVAMDGKTSRRARAKGGRPPHLVSAWASRRRLAPGQEAVAATSKKIAAIPLLLARLELSGAPFAIDPIGRQRGIAVAIRARGGPSPRAQGELACPLRGGPALLRA